MKSRFLFSLMIAAAMVFSSCENKGDDGDKTYTSDTIKINMGAGYQTDVYYSFANGVVKTEPRLNWDIAFQSSPRNSSIITNGGADVKLYTYPYAKINGWDDVDISDLSNWKPMYNSDTSWIYSAFEQHALGHPDYGWGVYNTTTHDIVGDSIFVIQLTDKTWRKLKIEKKLSVKNKYLFTYANIDGSNEVKDSIDLNNYLDRNFGYYSLVDSKALDREPISVSWDVLFTKYIEMVPTNEGGFSPYAVVGVLQNMAVKAAQINNKDANNQSYNANDFKTDIHTIGSDWKSFDMNSYTYNLVKDTSYFVKTKENKIYHIVFTGFEGSQTGKLKFNQTSVK